MNLQIEREWCVPRERNAYNGQPLSIPDSKFLISKIKRELRTSDQVPHQGQNTSLALVFSAARGERSNGVT